MTGMYLTDLAYVCGRAGLVVYTQDGWQSRARASGGFAEAADRYEIRFAGGASHVTVTTD